jgi:hypothetical protein
MPSDHAAAISVGALDSTWATFLLATLVLAAGVYLTEQARKSENIENAVLVFSTVVVLFGHLVAGGLGTLFAEQASDGAADSAATGAATAAPRAAAVAADQVSRQVEEALEAPPASGSGGGHRGVR